MFLANQRSRTLFIFLIAGISIPLAQAREPDTRRADNRYGLFHVKGAVLRDACRLDMASAWQEIDLGNTKTSQFANPGDRGQAATVELRLKDCQQIRRSQISPDTALLSWSESQPLVSVRFVAARHKDNDQLIAVNGVEGVGLRLTDRQQKKITLGQRGEPLFLERGTDTLIYYVAPERTQSALEANAWDAFVGFELLYD